MKINLTILLLLSAFVIKAQNFNPVAYSDSLITLFDKNLSSYGFVKHELVQNSDNFYVDSQNPTDTILLENFTDFKYYQTKSNDKYKLIRYRQGKYSDVCEIDTYDYFFSDSSLIMCVHTFVRNGFEVEDLGAYSYCEEKRICLLSDGNPSFIISRDGESLSSNASVNKNIKFTAQDPSKVFYPKQDYYTRGVNLYYQNKWKK